MYTSDNVLGGLSNIELAWNFFLGHMSDVNRLRDECDGLSEASIRQMQEHNIRTALDLMPACVTRITGPTYMRSELEKIVKSDGDFTYLRVVQR